MKEAYYFSHDSNARQDEKILMLRAEHGWEGYGIYWALVEMMFESRDTCLHHSKIKGISASYNIDITMLKSVIKTCIDEELFYTEDDDFWSESLRRRKDKFQEKKSQRSEAGKKGMAKRWANKGLDNTVITSLQDSNNVDITNHNKVKESKVKKSKVNNKRTYSDFVTMTEEEYKKLIDQFGEPLTLDHIEKLNLYKGSTGKKYKSDYMTILNWSRKDKKAVKKDERTTNNREQFNPDELSL